MENDGPVAAVQIRLAKGEITTVQYREILTHLMKNISSFQQTSSLKILQVRYAKGEVNADQYHEIFTNLMKNLSTQTWAPPLQILHERYAEGQISTSQYQEMISHLRQEQFTYDQSTPLWILNNRYARGELTTAEYEEVLSLFTEFTLALMKGAIKESGTQQAPNPQKKTEIQSSHPDSHHRPTHSPEQPAKPVSSNPLPPSAPDSKKQQASAEEKTSTTITFNDIRKEEKPEGLRSQIPEAVTGSGQKEIKKPDVVSDKKTNTDGDINKQDKSGEAEELSPEKDTVKDSDKLREIPLISISEKGTKTVGSSSGFPTDKSPRGAKETVDSSEKTADPGIQSGFPHFSSVASPAVQARQPEALPTSFLFHGGKPDHGETEAVAAIPAVPANPENLVNYLITPGSISGGEGNTYETVTSQISLTETSPASVPAEQKMAAQLRKEDTTKEIGEIRQKIKTFIVKGEYANAIALADSGIDLTSEDYQLFFYKGMAKYYLHDHENALKDLQYALGLCRNPDDIKKMETIINHINSKQDEKTEGSI